MSATIAEVIARLGQLRERAAELNRRDGPTRMSPEWVHACKQFEAMAVEAIPAILDHIATLTSDLAAARGEVAELRARVAKLHAGSEGPL